METLISRIESIVRDASSLMLAPFEITQKEGYSNIVTSSDIAVQDYLCERLEFLISGCGFLCEEKDMQRQEYDYTWIIDPIDGTANYARGIDQCAICVGLKHKDTMTAAVVYLPRTDEMFTAVKGGGAFLNGQRIRVSDRPFRDSVMCTALSVYHKEHTSVCSRIITETFLRCNDIRRFGAAAPELCYTAMGRCELYFEFLLSPWDFAAASLILSEAGGCLSALDGSPLPMDKPSGVIAANNSENLAILQEIVKNNL